METNCHTAENRSWNWVMMKFVCGLNFKKEGIRIYKETTVKLGFSISSI